MNRRRQQQMIGRRRNHLQKNGRNRSSQPIRQQKQRRKYGGPHRSGDNRHHRQQQVSLVHFALIKPQQQPQQHFCQRVEPKWADRQQILQETADRPAEHAGLTAARQRRQHHNHQYKVRANGAEGQNGNYRRLQGYRKQHHKNPDQNPHGRTGFLSPLMTKTSSRREKSTAERIMAFFSKPPSSSTTSTTSPISRPLG